MKSIAEQNLAVIRDELLPGEKVLAFGLGAKKNLNRLRTVCRILLLYGIAIAQMLMCCFSRWWPYSLDQSMFLIEISVVVSIFLFIREIPDTIGKHKCYAVTNERLLCITDDGVETVTQEVSFQGLEINDSTSRVFSVDFSSVVGKQRLDHVRQYRVSRCHHMWCTL